MFNSFLITQPWDCLSSHCFYPTWTSLSVLYFCLEVNAFLQGSLNTILLFISDQWLCLLKTHYLPGLLRMMFSDGMIVEYRCHHWQSHKETEKKRRDERSLGTNRSLCQFVLTTAGSWFPNWPLWLGDMVEIKITLWTKAFYVLWLMFNADWIALHWNPI